jgi:hypothetical protein
MVTRLRRSRGLVLVAVIALLGAGCASFNGIYNGPINSTISTYRIGPFNLAAMDEPGSESEAVQGNVPRPPGNIGIKSMHFDLVDASGNPYDRMDVHLHHVLLMNNAHTSPICAGEEERFSGSGAERTPLVLWGSYAYRTNSTDRWDALWHIMNMSESAKSVYIEYTVEYVPATDPAASRPVTPFFMDSTGCGTNAEFNVPGTGGPGSLFSKTRTFTAPWTGVAVAVGGHLHDGGKDITVRRDATGQIGCQAIAKYDEPQPMDFPSSITACMIHSTVTAGEKYTVTARYDNSMPHTAVMGIMLAYIWRGTPPA